MSQNFACRVGGRMGNRGDVNTASYSMATALHHTARGRDALLHWPQIFSQAVDRILTD